MVDGHQSAKFGVSQGFALVAVLSWTILLSIIVAATVYIATSHARDAKDDAEVAQLEGVADGAINVVILTLLAAEAAKRLPVDGRPFIVQFAGAQVSLTVINQAGRVDINWAPRELLVGMFLEFGLTAAGADAETDRILDWREPGELARIDGAKKKDYQDAGLEYGPRYGAFESLGEMRLVMGMPTPLLREIEPYLTTQSGDSGVNIAVAPSKIQKLMHAYSDPLLSNGALSGDAQAAHPTTVMGQSFRIRAVATRGSYSISRTAIIRFSGNAINPLWIYQWQ